MLNSNKVHMFGFPEQGPACLNNSICSFKRQSAKYWKIHVITVEVLPKRLSSSDARTVMLYFCSTHICRSTSRCTTVSERVTGNQTLGTSVRNFLSPRCTNHKQGCPKLSPQFYFHLNFMYKRTLF